MILRRFMKHVTDQNWLAVGLDVLVVIVGIFLGLQVQEWNEDRKSINQLNLAFDRLELEFKENLDLLNNIRVDDEVTSAKIQVGFKLLLNCESNLHETEVDKFNEILQITSSSRNIMIKMEAFDNLRNQDKFGFLLDDLILSALNDFNYKVNRIARETDYTELAAWENALFRLSDVTFKENSINGDFYVVPVFKETAIINCENDELVKSLNDYFSFILFKLENTSVLIDETEKILTLVRNREFE